MTEKELLELKLQLLKAMKLKSKYPMYGHSAQITGSDARDLERINDRNREKNEQYSNEIEQIKQTLIENGYPVEEVIKKWNELFKLYKYDLTETEKFKLIMLGEKYPSLKKAILDDVNLDQYFDNYNQIISGRKH